MQRKEIISQSLIIFSFELIEATLEGWKIDPNNLPTTIGTFGFYTVGMVKTDEHDAAAAALFCPEKPKNKGGRPPKSVNTIN